MTDRYSELAERANRSRCLSCNGCMVDAWICESCCFNSGAMWLKQEFPVYFQSPTHVGRFQQKQRDIQGEYDQLQAIWSINEAGVTSTDLQRAGHYNGGKNLDKHVGEASGPYLDYYQVRGDSDAVRIRRLLHAHHLPWWTADEKAKIRNFDPRTKLDRKVSEKFRVVLDPKQRKRKRQIMNSNASNHPINNPINKTIDKYRRRYNITVHAIDRYRQRIDATYRSCTDQEVGDLLDERICGSAEKVKVFDFDAPGEGKTTVVTCSNKDGAKYYAIVRDDTCVTILSPEIAEANFMNGKWKREGLNAPFNKATLANVIPVEKVSLADLPVQKTSDPNVGRRTLIPVVQASSSAPTVGLVVPIKEELPVASPASDQAAFQKFVMGQPASNLSAHGGSATQKVVPKSPLETLALELATQASVVAESKRDFEKAQDAFYAAQERLSDLQTKLSRAVAEASGMALQEPPERRLKPTAEALRQVEIRRAGGYDPRKGSQHPDNHDPTLPPPKKPEISARTGKPTKGARAGKGAHKEYRERREFTDADKAKYVELVKNGDSVGEVAKKFDLTESALRVWCKKAGVLK